MGHALRLTTAQVEAHKNRVATEQMKALKLAKPSKYKNVKTTYDGKEFDSAKEARRYQELKLLEAAFEITDLKCQRPVACVVNLIHVCDWIADFTYYCRKRKALIFEDAKGMKTDVYKLKKKLVWASTGIEITES